MSLPQHVEDIETNLNLQAFQAIEVLPHTNRFERTSANVSNITFGTKVTIRITDKNQIINGGFVLEYELGILTTTGGTFRRFVPGSFFADRIELKIDGQNIQTLHPDADFFAHQLFLTDDQRALYNDGMGDYTETTDRNADAAAGHTIFVPYRTVWDHGVPNVSAGDEWTVEVQLRPLADVVEIDGTAPVATITNLFLRYNATIFEQLDMTEVRKLVNENTLHYRFITPVRQSFPITSGDTFFRQTLSGIDGNITHLVFYIRNGANPSGADLYSSFVTITDFVIRDQNKNISSDLTITDRESRLLQMPNWTTSTWNRNSSSIDPVYMYSWVKSPSDVITTGQNHFYKVFSGNERIEINFPAVGADSTIEILAYRYEIFELDKHGGHTLVPRDEIRA